MHFILQIFTARLCVVHFCSNPFFISACIGQSLSLPRSLTTRRRHTLFCLLPFLLLLALMLIFDGLFHSLSITLFSPVLPLHSFDHLFVDVFSDSYRLSVTMAYLLSPSSTFCASNNDFVFFFVSVSQINRNFSLLAPIFPCRLMVPLLLLFFSPAAYHTETIIF